MTRFGFIILSALLLTGCGGKSVKSQISSFSSINNVGYNDTFFIVPSEQQASTAEFFSYANSISGRLVAKGMSRVNNPVNARYVVFIDYGVAGSNQVATSTPIYGQTGGGLTTHSGSIYGTGGFGSYSGTSYTMPTYGVVGSVSGSRTVYQRFFKLTMFDSRNNTPVYETQASSNGSSGTFGQVAECIFNSALESFPQASNGTDWNYDC
jgi:hypothetical protein